MSAEAFRALLTLLENASLLMLGVLGFCYLRDRVGDRPRAVSETLQGIIGSALAVVAMYSPMQVGAGVQIDSRDSIIVIVTLFGGPIAGAITCVAAAAYRMSLGGAGAVPGAIGIVAAYVLALGFRAYIRAHGNRVRHAHIFLLGLFTAALVLSSVAAASWLSGANLLDRAVLPILLIVPASMLLFGSIVLRFDRARALEQVIVENEALFRAVVDNLPDTLSVRDRDNRFLLVNREYERRYGHTVASLLGRPAQEVWDRTEVRIRLEDSSARAWTGETVRTSPLPIRRADSFGWVVCTTFPVRNARGEIVSVGTLTSDVTEMIAAREALQARERTLARHQQVLTEILRRRTGTNRAFLDEVKPILETVAEALDVDKVTVWEMDVEADLARCIDEWDRLGRRHGMVPDAKLSAFGTLLDDLEQNRVIAIEDTLADERLAARWAYFRENGVRSGLIAASYLSPKMQAFLTLSQTGQPRSWTPEEMTFSQAVAGVVSLMLLMRRHSDALAALDMVTNGILAEREDGRVIYANRPAIELAGLDYRGPWATQATGLSSRLFPRPTKPLVGDRDRHAIEWTVGSAAKDLEIHRSRLPDGGSISVIVDVTARYAGQRERRRLQSQLDQASRMEAIGQLAGGIAHDFNNLLGAISGFASFLDQDLPPQSEQHLFARRILSASERGKALVSQILTFTRVRAIERTPLDLRDLVLHMREILTGSMPPSVRVAFHLGSEPVCVLGNPEQISQVLSNLCINARDALSERGGDIDVVLSVISPGAPDYSAALLLGSLDPSRRYARIQVCDTGTGMPTELLPRIFEPFFTTKERGRGTGLGLAIVHGIVVSHEGACAVESVAGRGTTFSIYLPISATSAASASMPKSDANARGGERVLVVDDEIDITDMLEIGLERLGYEVAAVNSSLEALEVFAEDPSAWDVVITDHLMPDLQGFDLAQRIKAIRADATVIVCTGLDDGVVAAAAQKAGIGFLPKPASAETIASYIRTLRARTGASV